MLTLSVDADAGSDLRNELLPQMLALAGVTRCRIELKANETTFWVEPDDSIGELKAAYDRLYPASTLVATFIRKPAPRANHA